MRCQRDVADLLATKLAFGTSLRQAAEELGVSEATARRRFKDPRFRERVQEIRRRAVDDAIGQMVAAMTAAVTKLRNLIENGERESTQLRAALGLIDLTLKAAALADLQERVEQLEQLRQGRNSHAL
jgi:AcrR family transcriptional regulator